MRNILKLEVKKAIKNKLFLCSIIIGCTVTMLSFIFNLGVYEDQIKLMTEITDYNTYSDSYSLYNHWIGGEPFSLGTTIYFFIFPLLVAIPYGWSYCEEKKSGYVRNMIVKTGKRNYYLAKYIAVFVSGGLAMIIPLIFNFAVSSLVFPASIPKVQYDTSTGIWVTSLMSYLYYTVPILYISIYMLIDFVFCGLIACISYSVTSFIKQKVVAVILPMIIILLLHYSTQFIYNPDVLGYKEISPLYFLRPVGARYVASWYVIIGEAAAIFVITAIFSMVWEQRHEIY